GPSGSQTEYVRFSYRKDGSVSAIHDRSSTSGALDDRTFTYDAQGRLGSTTLPGMFAVGASGDSILTFLYEGSGTGLTPGRMKELELGVAGDSDKHYSFARFYRSDTGLLDSLQF